MSFRDAASNAVPVPCEGQWDAFEPLPTGAPLVERVAQEQRAKALCATCPAAVECLATATRHDLGIRGGLTWGERYDREGRRVPVRAMRRRES